MNKRQKELLQSQLKDEKEIIKELKKIYGQAEKDIDNKIAALLARTDLENLQSIIYQVDYQKALRTQIGAILDDLNANQFTSISEYLTKCYESGFLGTLYDIQGQGVPLIFPIDQNQVVKAITTDSKLSKRLYTRLGEDVDELKKKVRLELSRGISQAYSYADIARNIRNQTKIGMNRSMRIARTEGHRVTQQATFDSQQKAKKAGADIVKQWDSTLDSRTRPMHQQLDGQIRELDEPFNVGIYSAMYPSGFGVASMDVNCRCVLLQRARWALEDEEDIITKFDGESGQIVNIAAKDYKDFVKNYYETLDKNAEISKNVKKVERFQKELASGKINTNVRSQKQGEHVSGTNARKRRIENDIINGKTPSSEFFSTVDVNELIKNSIGKGEIWFGRKQKYPKEFISSDSVIGIVWNAGKNSYVETKRFEIVYSKNGVHAFPVKEV